MTALPRRWVSIDPGDRHVGFAMWESRQCTKAYETTPDECLDTLDDLIERGELDAVVAEDFALYGWKASTMNGNRMLTPRMLGAIERTCKKAGVPLHQSMAATHKRLYRLDWFNNLTAEQKVAMPWHRKGGHAKDAWCVGEWFAIQREQN